MAQAKNADDLAVLANRGRAQLHEHDLAPRGNDAYVELRRLTCAQNLRQALTGFMLVRR
jgi:hypothetical protein